MVSGFEEADDDKGEKEELEEEEGEPEEEKGVKTIG